MDQFIGTWKLVSSENFEMYLDALGYDEVLREISKTLNPTITISQENDLVEFYTKTAVGDQIFSFKLGEEFDRKTIDGRNCKVTVTLCEEKLIEVLKWDGERSRYYYEIKDGQMVWTMVYQDIIAVHTFEKV